MASAQSLCDIDSFVCVTWLAHTCEKRFMQMLTQIIRMWDMTHSYVKCKSRICERNRSLIYMTYDMYKCASVTITHSYMWHDLFI